MLIRAAIFLLLLTLAVLWPAPATPHNPITTTVLFNREIAALLNAKCNQCHSAGKLAMPLQTYAQARPWAQAIKEEALARHMPPWPAQRGVGTFANDLGLTIRELDFLISWVDGGTPEGDGTAAEFVDHGAHWMLGMPDKLLRARAGAAITTGAPPQMRRIVIDTDLPRETWLKGFDYKPGDGRVTRAAFISVDGTDQFIGGWTPWAQTMELPPGLGVRLPARARLAVDVLYQSADVAVTDQPQIGLYFANAAEREVRTLKLTSAAPSVTLPAETNLLSIRVDARPGTRSLEIRARRPDGSITPLLRMKDVRAEWQTPFVFARPMRLTAGSVLQAIVKDANGAVVPGVTVWVNSAAAAPSLRVGTIDSTSPLS